MTALNSIFFFSGSKKEDILSGTPNFSYSVEYQVIILTMLSETHVMEFLAFRNIKFL